MRKIQILGLALGAVFAFSAIAAASAFAESEFLANGAVITEELASEGSGELTLSTLVLGITAVKIDCSGIFDGTVGPKNLDLITELLNLSKELISLTALSGLALSCEVLTSFNSECGAVGGLAELWAVNLPWLTELLLMTAAPEWLIDLVSSGVGNPGYYVLCSNGKTNQCVGPTSASAENEVGGLLVKFNPAAPISSEKGNCTEGGEGAGDIEGEGLTALVAGGPLAMS
jgi:hypothetical protein